MKFIRPRQDFSMARMAQAMRCLVLCDFVAHMHVYRAGKVPELLIRIESMNGFSDPSGEIEKQAIVTLCDMEHFNLANFKIIDLSDAEVLAEVD